MSLFAQGLQKGSSGTVHEGVPVFPHLPPQLAGSRAQEMWPSSGYRRLAPQGWG